jgi:DNA invertase Pin-like site-specific DNA recombinase
MASRKLKNSPLPAQRQVYGYARVSSAGQADSGISLDEQQRRIAARAIENGWTLTHVFVDAGVSGSIPLAKRPEGSRLLAALRPGDVVVSAGMDRCFRSALDALTVVNDFRRRRISLWLLDLGNDCTGNGIAQLLTTILGAVAEFERGLISERISDAKQQQRRAGKHLGGTRPFGYQLQRREAKEGERPRAPELVEDPEEQAAIKLMRKMRDQGASLTAIAAFLRGRGHKISSETVRVVL